MILASLLSLSSFGYILPDYFSIGSSPNRISVEINTPLQETREISAGIMNTTYPKLVNPEDATLKKLVEYKEVLGTINPEYIMVFTRIPCNRRTSRDFANEVGEIAKEYSLYGYKPIIIFEPGEGVNGAHLSKIKTGVCDPYIDLFFSELFSTLKITEKQLGLVVPYPEINTPAFDRTDFSPSDFAPLVNNFFLIAQKYYPTLRGSVLLDSKTYVTDDWGRGEYVSFKPYLDGMNPKYITSFGLQGFPWMSEDGESKFFNIRSILPENILKEAALLLNTKNIWFNTGTLGRAYRNELRISPQERWKMLNALLMYQRSLKLKGYTTMVHLFSENNLSLEGENMDWSYTQSKDDMLYLGEFIKRLQKSSVKVGFYDR